MVAEDFYENKFWLLEGSIKPQMGLKVLDIIRKLKAD